MPAYPKLNKRGVFWVSVSKWGKLIKLAQKEENSGSFGGKVQKKFRKKSNFNKHTVFNNHTGWIFFPKIINVRYQISTYGLDFGPKKLIVHCTTIRYCRVRDVNKKLVLHKNDQRLGFHHCLKIESKRWSPGSLLPPINSRNCMFSFSGLRTFAQRSIDNMEKTSPDELSKNLSDFCAR